MKNIDKSESIYLCPKCHGKGELELYYSLEDYGNKRSARWVLCKLCGGSGLIDWVTRAICGQITTVYDDIIRAMVGK